MDVEDMLLYLMSVEHNISELQEDIKLLKLSALDLALETLQETPEPRKREIVSLLYWAHGAIVGRVALADSLGMPANQLAKYVYDATLTVRCGACNAPVEVHVASMTEYKSLQSRRGRTLCPSCKAKEETQNAANLARWREERQQQSERLHDLETMPYHEYLATPEWQEIRKRKLRNARFRCELCHCVGQLHVHHKTYERRGHEDYTDLIVLCANCHAKFHDKLPKD